MKISTVMVPGILQLGVLAALFLMIGPTNSFAACPVPNPKDSAIYIAFDEYVRDHYRLREDAPWVGGDDRFELAYGHALGRLATAVAGDARRKEAFDCVKTALAQRAHTYYGLLQGKTVMNHLQQAARGMRDKEVDRTFGVRDTSHLDIVFVMANRLVGGGGTSGGGTGGGGTVGGRDGGGAPPGGGWVVVGTNASCPTTMGQWSLREARARLRQANELAVELERRFGRGAYCEGDAWYLCRDIKHELFRARDIVNYLFEQNYDGRSQCRMCDYRALLPAARSLREWVRWTEGRGFQMGANINTAYILENRLNDPLCRKPVPATFPPGEEVVERGAKPGRECPARYGNTFSMTANAGIPGHNRRTLDGVSLNECRQACISSDWCLSFDFERAAERCFLQPVNACNTTLRLDYPANPYDHYSRNGLE